MFSRILSLAGTAAVLGALLSTATPVHLGAVDRAGFPIPCGNGFHPSFEVAEEQDRLNFVSVAMKKYPLVARWRYPVLAG